MYSKRHVVLTTILAVALAVLTVTLIAQSVFHVPLAGLDRAQAFIPKQQNADGKDPAALADILDDELVYTYESQKSITLKTQLRNVPVQLFSVNYAYPIVTGLPLAGGSFFTKTAEDMLFKHIVLNEQAAFQLFGGTDIIGQTLEWDGQIFEIVGILADGLDDATAYASAALTGENAQAFMALPDAANGLSTAHVLNLMKQAGVTTKDYDIIDTGKLRAMMPGKTLFLGTLIPIGIGVWLIIACSRGLRNSFAAVQAKSKRYYWHELLRHESILLGKTILLMLGIAGAAIGLFSLGLLWMDLFLVYDPLRLITARNLYALPHFAAVLAPIYTANAASTAISGGIVLCLIFLFIIKRRS